MKRKLLAAGAALIGALVAAILISASVWPVINVVETGKTPEYADLKPLYFSADPQRVYDEAKAAAAAVPRWQVVSEDVSARTIRAEATTPTLKFVDDITVRVEPATEFVTIVNIRSASRVGKGDFGQNARNIRAFQAEMNKRLGAVKFDPNAPK
jgi:uncharacterized protein (DUF1499 family)